MTGVQTCALPISRFSQPWFTRDCKKAVRKKKRLYNKAKKSKEVADWKIHTYSDFISKLTRSIDQITPNKVIRLKNRSEDWFDSEICNAIRIRNKRLKKFKKTRLIIDEENYKESKKTVRNLINFKKTSYFKNKLKENIGRPKELWKTLKNLGLPHKSTSGANICLKNNEKTSFDAKENANLFQDFFSNLANNLFLKLPEAPKRFGKESLSLYYDKLCLSSKNFNFFSVSEEEVLKMIQIWIRQKPRALTKLV